MHKTKGKKHASTKTTPDFRKKVMSVVKRQQEVKTYNGIVYNDQPLTLLDTGVTPPTVYDLAQPGSVGVFNIPQGISDGERVGDKVKIRSLVLKGCLVNNAIANRPFYIKMFVLKDKDNQQVNDFADLFELNGAATTPLNLLSDIYQRVRTDRYIVYAARVFKLGPSDAATNPNNDFAVSRMFSINLTKHIKQIQFNDNSAFTTSPNNMQLVFVGCYADNTPITFGPYTGPTVDFSICATIRYADA